MREYELRKYDGSGNPLGSVVAAYPHDEKAMLFAAGMMQMPVQRLEVWHEGRSIIVITVQ